MPETYSFIRGDSRDSIVLRAQKAMDAAVAQVWKTRDAELPLKTPRELLILASIVEKETGVECLIRERGVKDFCHFQRSIGCRGDVSAAGYAVDRT